MATLTRPRPRRRSFPIRLLAVVGAMLVMVVVSQVASHLRSASSPPRQPPVVVDPLQPGIGDLDAGAISGSGGGGSGADAGPAAGAGAAADPVSDVARIKADIEFWSSRVARDRDDFISSNRWGISEIELARATGDLSAFLSRIVPDIDGAMLAAGGLAKIRKANIDKLPLVRGTPRIGR